MARTMTRGTQEQGHSLQLQQSTPTRTYQSGTNFSCSCHLHPPWDTKQAQDWCPVLGLAAVAELGSHPATNTTGRHGHPCVSPWALSFPPHPTRGWDLAQNTLIQADAGGLPSDLISGHGLSVCRRRLVRGQRTLQPKPNRSSQHVIHPKTQLFLVLHKVSSWEGQGRMHL